MEEEITQISNNSEVKESSNNSVANNHSQSTEERLRRKRTINYLEDESDSDSKSKDNKKTKKSHKEVSRENQASPNVKNIIDLKKKSIKREKKSSDIKADVNSIKMSPLSEDKCTENVSNNEEYMSQGVEEDNTRRENEDFIKGEHGSHSSKNNELETKNNLEIKLSKNDDNKGPEDDQADICSSNEIFVLKRKPGRPKLNGEVKYIKVKMIKVKKYDRRGRPRKIDINDASVVEKEAKMIKGENGDIVKKRSGRPRKSVASSINESIYSDKGPSNQVLENGENQENDSKKQRKFIKKVQSSSKYSDFDWHNRKAYKKVLGRPRKSLSLIKFRKSGKGIKVGDNVKPRGRPRKIIMESKDDGEVDEAEEEKEAERSTLEDTEQVLNNHSQQSTNLEEETKSKKTKRNPKKSSILTEPQAEPLKSTRNSKKASALLLKKAKVSIKSAINIKNTPSVVEEHKKPSVLQLMNVAARRASLDKLANLEALLTKLEEEHENTKELLRMSEIKSANKSRGSL